MPLKSVLLAFLFVSVALEPALSVEREFDQYGGLLSLQGEATGFFHLQEFDNKHFLVTPDGHG